MIEPFGRHVLETEDATMEYVENVHANVHASAEANVEANVNAHVDQNGFLEHLVL